MRIEFANAVHKDLDWSGHVLRIGSAEDNHVVLNQQGVAAHHMRIVRDARGLVLEVQPGAGRVYVNARPVRERALLRLGDTLGVGGCRLRLCADTAVPTQPPTGTGHRGTTTTALRAVAGPLSGRVFSVHERLELGARGRIALVSSGIGDATLSIVRKDDALTLDAESLPAHVEICVNGVAVRSARLHDGDQIAVGSHRFVLDAWVPPTSAQAIRDALLPQETALPEDAAGPRNEVWWLIVTAAVLALVIALLLLIRL